MLKRSSREPGDYSGTLSDFDRAFALSAKLMAQNLDNAIVIPRSCRLSTNPSLQTNRVVQSCRPGDRQFYAASLWQFIVGTRDTLARPPSIVISPAPGLFNIDHPGQNRKVLDPCEETAAREPGRTATCTARYWSLAATFKRSVLDGVGL